MAVGDYEVGGVTKTLIERSGGGIWTWMPTGPALNPSTTMNVLNGVSCVVSKFCEAVGFYIDANGLQKTLIERWSYSTGGAAWRRDASANPEPHDILNGVSCVRWPKPVCGLGFSPPTRRALSTAPSTVSRVRVRRSARPLAAG